MKVKYGRRRSMIRDFKKVMTVVLAVFLITLGISSVSFAASTGPIAHYKFDGDLKDSSGNGNDGTNVGDVTFADNGVFDKCAVFDGGFVKLAENSALNLGNQCTISAWVELNADQAKQNDIYTIITKTNNNDREFYKDGFMYHAYLQGTHDVGLALSQLHDGYEPGVGSSGVGSLDFHERWSMVSFVNDGTNLYLYVDGKLHSTDITSDNPSYAPFDDAVAGDIFIGGPSDYGFFKGKMDDLRLYNYALSSNEIKALYDASGTYSNKIVLQIDEPMMMVDDKEQEIDPGRGTVPVIVSSRTLVPIRAIIEAMGGTIGWTQSEQRVDITLKSKQLQLWINKTTAKLNGAQLAMDVPPMLMNQRTMLPLRFVSENLGCKVDWDNSTQKITISYNK